VTSDGKIKVMIVDDHPLMRVGIAAIINARPDMTVTGQAGTGEEAIALFRKSLPDLTLMDLRLPGLISGVDAIARIRTIQPQAKVIVVTTYEGDEDIHRALEVGARGYVIKGMPYQTLVEALQRVHAGSRFIPPPVAKALASRTPNSDLSTRELEVLEQLVAGKSNKEIAGLLFISEGTVKTHVLSIHEKLGAGDRTEAVVIAIRRGILRV